MRHGNSQVGRDIFDKHIELGLKGLCRWPTISSEFIKPALRREFFFLVRLHVRCASSEQAGYGQWTSQLKIK